jgi:hypothetical protein
MYKTVGTVFLVLAIGTVAIAWSQRPAQKGATSSLTISPYELQLGAKPLPVQEFTDLTFVF